MRKLDHARGVNFIDVANVYGLGECEETVGAFVELQQQGKVRDIGLSNVGRRQLALAQSLCSVASVQNLYSVGRSLTSECDSAGPRRVPEWRRRSAWGASPVGRDRVPCFLDQGV